MLIKEELLFDFAVNMPRVLVSGKTTILDNVKQVMLLTDEEILVFNGKGYTSVRGHEFFVERLMDERMLITGEVEEIRFFGALQKGTDRRKQPDRSY